MPCTSQLQLIAPEAILPNEEHDPVHAEQLAQSILREGLWRIPISVELHSLAVMDGHHRLAAARRLGLSCVPCLMLDYTQVAVHASREGFLVTPDEIVARSRQAQLYPAKTTHHVFAGPLPLCNISIGLLQSPERKWTTGAFRNSALLREWRT